MKRYQNTLTIGYTCMNCNVSALHDKYDCLNHFSSYPYVFSKLKFIFLHLHTTFISFGILAAKTDILYLSKVIFTLFTSTSIHEEMAVGKDIDGKTLEM